MMPGTSAIVHARTRGRTSLTELGLGGAQLGNLYREISDDDAPRRIVDTAWDSGIRYFDTAPHYGLGLSERRLGLAAELAPRDEYVLSTKVGRLLVPDRERRRPDATTRASTSRRPGACGTSAATACSARSRRASSARPRPIDVAYMHDPDDHWERRSTEASAR